MPKDDGSIVIGVDLSAKQAERDLAKLKEKIQKTEQDIETMQNERGAAREKSSVLGAEIEAEQRKLAELKQQLLEVRAIAQDKSLSESTREEAKLNIPSVKQEVDEQATRVRLLEAEYRKTENAVDKYDQKIKDSNENLKKMAEEAGGLQKQLAKIPPQMEKAHKHTSKFASRIKEVVRSALVFTLISQSLAKFREWMGKTIKTNDEATAAIARLKGSLLTLAQPILEVVIPAFIKLVDWLSRVIGTIAGFVSALFGKTVEESSSAAESMNNEANAIEGVGAAAKKSSKQLAAFDEINKLTFNEDGGGGGGASTGTIKPDFNFAQFDLPEWLDNFLSKLQFNIKDVLFDWDDLTGEQIAKKAIAGVAGLCGAVAGFMIGGVPGAIVGSLLGVLLGLVIDSLVFDNDGKINKEELLSMIVIALGALVGGVIGFVTTKSIKGAAIGAMVGMALTAVISSLVFDNDGKISGSEVRNLIGAAVAVASGGVIGALIGGPMGALVGATIGMGVSLLINGFQIAQKQKVIKNFYNTEAGKELKKIVDNVAANTEFAVDLRARVDSITGEVDAETIADFTLAQQLIDEIFEMDAADNKTAEQIALINEKIELLNSLNLEGINLAFDEATGHVNTTKEAIQNNMDALLQQYRIEAMREAYIEAYRAQYDAQVAMNEAQEDYNALLEAWESASADYNATYDKLTNRMYDSKSAMFDLMGQASEQKIVMDELASQMMAAGDVLGDLQGIYVDATGKVDTITQSLTDFSGALSGDAKNAMLDRSGNTALDAAMQTTTGAIGKATEAVHGFETTINETTEEMAGHGASFMEELASGILSGKTTVEENMRSVMSSVLSIVQSGINAVNSVFASVKASMPTTGQTSVSVPRFTVPHLAQGAVIPPNREFLAVLGDQRNGSNIEAPASMIKQMVREALREAGGTGGGRDITVILQVDKREFARTVYRANNDEMQRVGVQFAGAKA